MFENKIALINALKKEYELNSLDMFSLKGIKKYNNMVFRFYNNKLQCYFAIDDIWKNANDAFANEILDVLLNQKASLVKSIKGEDIMVEPKGLIKDTEEFYKKAKDVVLDRAVKDVVAAETAEALVTDYKALGIIKSEADEEAKAVADEPQDEDKNEMVSSIVDKEEQDLVNIRQKADAFNEKLNVLKANQPKA